MARKEGDAWPDAETAALLHALARQSPFAVSETGPDGERLRAQAFRVMVLGPIRRLLRFCRRRLGQRSHATTAYRAETVQEACGRRRE